MPPVFLTTRILLTLTLALALLLGYTHAHVDITTHTTSSTTAADVIAALNLTANPEKGYYVQTFSDPTNVTFTAVTSGSNGSAVVPYETTRAASTAIYYLLEGADGDSLWHRIDAVEVWHYYAGAPLRLRLSYDGDSNGSDSVAGEEAVLGPDVVGGQRPQVVIGRWQWQSARSLGNWTLVGTTGEAFLSLFLLLSFSFFSGALL